MLLRCQLMALLAGMKAHIATAMTIKHADHNIIEDLPEPTDSRPSFLRDLAEKKKQQHNQVDFVADEFSLRTPKPCECIANEIKKTLTLFNGPDPPILSAYRGGKAKIITLLNQISDSVACRHADGTSMFGRPFYQFKNPETLMEITDFPHQGLTWDASTNQLTLQPQNIDPLGLHKVLITAYLPSFKDVFETAEIAYFVHSAPNLQLQNEEQTEPDTGQSHRMLQDYQAYCTNPKTMLNLFNTAALAEQSSFWPTFSQTAQSGCDGEMILINRVSQTFDQKKLVHSEVHGTPGAPQFWKVTFQQQTLIKTTLIFNRDDNYSDRLKKCIVTVGNNPDVSQNPICVPLGAMDEGGWHICPNSMNGIVFGVYTTNAVLNFMEAMAFSQDAIQLNAGVTVSFLGTNLASDLASNAIQKFVVVKANDFTRQKCVKIYPPAEGLATLSIKFPAQYLIKAVVLFPGFQQVGLSDWPFHQNNVAIYVNSEGGTQKLCGVQDDYYATTNYEVACNFQANEIILVQQTAANTLRFCGFGALADCNCSQSSLDPSRFTTPQTPLVSITSLLIKSTDSVQTIQITQIIDTVSSSSGCVSCGSRSLSFKDKLTGILITSWPYKGYNFDASTFKITLDPTQADATSTLTVTISLDSYPTVLMSQDITVIVQFVAPVVAQAASIQPLKIDTMALNAMINQQAILQLPKINASYTYSIASKPRFEASIDSTQLRVFSNDEQDVGAKYLDLVATSLTNKVTFKVNVIFTSAKIITTQKSSSMQVSAETTSSDSKPAVVSQSAHDSKQTQSELISYLEKVECDEDGTCVDPTNSRFSCYFDEETSKMVCGVDLFKKEKNKVTKQSNANSIISPTLEISAVDNKGFFTMTFSQRMNFSSLINETYSTSENARSKEAGTNSTNFSQYLLTVKHVKIAILANSDQDSSKLQFEWVVSNITDRKIKFQVLFKNPAFISQDFSSPDYLVIKLLSPFLVVKAEATNLIITNPLRTVRKRLPNQLVLSAATEIVGETAVTVKTASQAVVIGNFILSVFLSGALATMYLMINSFQMLMSYSYLVVPMPANVTMVMVQIDTIASFDYLPTDTVFDQIFKFSETEMPFTTFQAMGVGSTRLTLYLGTIFFILALIFVLSIIFLISWPFKKTVTLVRRFHNMMKTKYYWRGIIRFLLESYSDMSIGIMLSWRVTRFDNASDVFDSVLTFLVTLIVIGGPISSYLLLLKYKNELQGQRFQSTYGSLTQGYFTTGVLGCQATRYMILWFLLRRFITAISIVFLGDQSPVWQIASLMYLSLADVLVNFHLNAFESTARSIMAKVNDIVVFLLSYFPFVYSGLVPNPESRYEIGWFQVTLIGLMFLANVAVVIWKTIIEMMQEFRRVKVEKSNFQKLKGMGYTLVIVVETIWQKLARLFQLEWVFYDSRPDRLNVQISSYVDKFRHQQAEDLVDQQYELEFYEYQLDELKFYQNAKNPVQIAPQEQIRLVQDPAVNIQIRQNQSSEFELTFGKSSTISTEFKQRLPKIAFMQIMEEVFDEDKIENSPILEEKKTEFVVPLNESFAERVKRSWLNADRTETRGNQVAQFNAVPQNSYKPRPKKQVFVPVQVVKETDSSKATAAFFKEAKENQVILCLEKIKASKQKMSIKFTDFVDLLPSTFMDLAPEAQLDEVDYLYNFLIQPDDKPQMQLQEEIDFQPFDEFSSPLQNYESETFLIEMQAKPAKKRIV